MSEEVQQMFDAIARRYDRANHVLSLGIDTRWRKKAVRAAGARKGTKVLDLACGTGDLTFEFQRAVAPVAVTGADFSEGMLRVARQKAAKRQAPTKFEFADALDLPYLDRSFDVTSMAFGIRNVDDPVHCLREMARVTKRGGRVIVLEFGQPTGAWGKMYRTYSRQIIPRVGGWITGKRDAYEYLPRTAAAFPAGPAFLQLMGDADVFAEVRGVPLSGGVAWLYRGDVA